MVLGTGDVVPADLRLFEAKDFKVSEMALTGALAFSRKLFRPIGEPDDVAKTAKVKEKKEGAPEKLTPETMAFSGCSITSGVGKGLVTDTGMKTRASHEDLSEIECQGIGRIAQLINGDAAWSLDGLSGCAQGSNKKTTCFCFPDTSANQTPLQQNLNKLGARIGILAIIICAPQRH